MARGSAARIAGVLGGIPLVLTLTGALLSGVEPSGKDSRLGVYTEENGYLYTYFGEEKMVPLEEESISVGRRQGTCYLQIDPSGTLGGPGTART